MNRDHANIGQSTAEPAEGADDLPPRQEGSPRAAPPKEQTQDTAGGGEEAEAGRDR